MSKSNKTTTVATTADITTGRACVEAAISEQDAKRADDAVAVVAYETMIMDRADSTAKAAAAKAKFLLKSGGDIKGFAGALSAMVFQAALKQLKADDAASTVKTGDDKHDKRVAKFRSWVTSAKKAAGAVSSGQITDSDVLDVIGNKKAVLRAIAEAKFVADEAKSEGAAKRSAAAKVAKAAKTSAKVTKATDEASAAAEAAKAAEAEAKAAKGTKAKAEAKAKADTAKAEAKAAKAAAEAAIAKAATAEAVEAAKAAKAEAKAEVKAAIGTSGNTVQGEQAKALEATGTTANEAAHFYCAFRTVAIANGWIAESDDFDAATVAMARILDRAGLVLPESKA